MKLVVTHAQPDFDAIASMALALRVHPDSVAALHGSLPASVERLVARYRDTLRLTDVDAIDPATVEALIVVDTADRRRLGPFEALLDRCPVTLYDHHPTPAAPIEAAGGLVERVGATVTLLLRILRARDVALPPATASLALLGLHEDTGGFRYPSTTHADHEAAAHLLQGGGNLRLVRELLTAADDAEQRRFGRLVADATAVRSVAGRRVAVAAFDHGSYLADVAPWADDLRTRTGADAAVLSVAMEGRTLLFARSDGAFDVAAALRGAYAGGGHPGAAFARSDASPAEALERTLAELAHHGTAVVLASELMSRPVKTVPADASVAEALGLLLRFGHNGLPVLSDGELVGMVSRRDLDRAVRHELDGRPVAQIMRAPVVTADPDTPLAGLEALVQERGVGRIPIVADGRLLGIVTRSDLLAARHPPRAEAGPEARIVGRFPPGAVDLIEALSAITRELGGRAYLVGGTVRDGLLGSGLHDLDASLEGVPVVEVARRMQRRFGGSVGCHADFGTCTLHLPGGLVLDLAETRAEFYAAPGALPSVAPSGLVQDLARRDFTINAMALRIAPEPRSLVDPFGGRDDLERRRLRTLHPLSFREDPTRLLRGARLAARLGLAFEAATEAQARRAVDDGVFDTVSASRLRHELELALAEGRAEPTLARLDGLGALEGAFGLPLPQALIAALDSLRGEGRTVPPRSYLLALLVSADDGAAVRHVERFHWPRRVLSVRTALLAAAGATTLTDGALEALGVPGRALLEALAPQHAGRVRSFESPPYRRKVRGRDVIDLGLPPGPDVGAVLRDIDRARAEGRVASFDDELDLARRLVAALDTGAGRE